MIPLAVPNLCGNEEKYLKECVTSTYVSSVGPFVNRFEQMTAQASGAKYGVAVSSGTAGLHTALMTIGVSLGDLVILPSFTFIASANAISHCGATPWLFDIDPRTWCLDYASVREKLRTETKLDGKKRIHKPTGKVVKAIMPVYTLGLPAEMDEILNIAKEYGLYTVADSAPALGATYKGKSLGGLCDLSVYSFNGNKTVTAGAGGVIVGDNKELLDLARHLSTTARQGLDYNHDRVGYNYRMTNLQAAVGCAQLEHLDKFNAAKKRIRKNYNEALKDIEGIGLFPQGERDESVCWFSGVTIDSSKHPSVKDISIKLKENGIESRSFWKPVHLQTPYLATPRTSMEVSENLWDSVLTLPCSTQLTDQEQQKVIESLRRILK